MEQQERRNEVREIRDPETNKLLARVDHDRQAVEFRPYRSRTVWVPLRLILDERLKPE